jgi:hypothetical protein
MASAEWRSSSWMTVAAWASSAFKLAGGRVGMSTARITPASVACNPAS